jgi:hypothetical protein
MQTLRILVCGGRNWTNRASIFSQLQLLRKLHIGPITVIEGGANGADTLAKSCAWQLQMNVEEYQADWTQYGKAAGPKRNQTMLDTGIHRVLAFHPDLSKSKGTKDMVTRAARAGITVNIFTE